MTQAKIMRERLLLAPHLIHLDAFLAMIGKTTRASRPDLVGLSLPAVDVTIAVEAKGRTGGRVDEVVRKAKEQARSLPGVCPPALPSALPRSRPLTPGGGGWPAWRIRPAQSGHWTR